MIKSSTLNDMIRHRWQPQYKLQTPALKSLFIITHTNEIKLTLNNSSVLDTFFSIFNITKAFIKQCGEKQPCSAKTINSVYAEGLQIISQRISSVNNAVNNDEKAWLQSPLESVLGTHTI